MIEDALRLIAEFPAGEEEKSRELITGLLRHGAEPFSRGHYTPGHITCTGVVLSPDRESLLLVHHRRLDRWLAPGGHVEPEDIELWRAALREVMEETGALIDPTVSPTLVGMDVHGIPPKKGEPYHLHHDLKFGFVAMMDHVAVSEEENRAVEWCRFAEFERYELPGSIRRAAARARERYAS